MASSSSWARAPAKHLQRDSATRVEAHVLALEAEALDDAHGADVATNADPALGVDNAVPRNLTPIRERAQGVSHEARLSG